MLRMNSRCPGGINIRNWRALLGNCRSARCSMGHALIALGFKAVQCRRPFEGHPGRRTSLDSFQFAVGAAGVMGNPADQGWFAMVRHGRDHPRASRSPRLCRRASRSSGIRFVFGHHIYRCCAGARRESSLRCRISSRAAASRERVVSSSAMISSYIALASLSMGRDVLFTQ